MRAVVCVFTEVRDDLSASDQAELGAKMSKVYKDDQVWIATAVGPEAQQIADVFLTDQEGE